MENDEKKDEGQAQATDTSQTNGSEAPPEATGKTINISGKQFNVSDDVAQAITAFTTDVDRRFQERSEELGGLRQFRNDALQREQELQANTKKDEKPELSTIMYENPDEFVDIISQNTKKQIDGLRTEYKQAESVKKEEGVFWNSIWSENKDLEMIKDRAADVIKMVGGRYAHLNLPNTKQSRDLIAGDARNWIKGIIGTPANGDTNSFIEGGSQTPTPVKKKTEEKPRETTKQMYDRRRGVKRKAMANRT